MAGARRVGASTVALAESAADCGSHERNVGTPLDRLGVRGHELSSDRGRFPSSGSPATASEVSSDSVLIFRDVSLDERRFSMTARAKKMIEGLAELSKAELAEVAREFPQLRTVNDNVARSSLRGPEDLLKLLQSLRAGPEFAEDLEAVIRETQAQELEPSPWES